MAGKAIISAAAGILMTFLFVVYRRDRSGLTDWSIPEKGRFNAGGWYHLAFMFLQTSFIAYSLLSFFDYVLLWLPAAGFLLTLIVQWTLEKKKRAAGH